MTWMLRKPEAYLALLLLAAAVACCGCQSEPTPALSELEDRVVVLEKATHELTHNYVHLHSQCQRNLGKLGDRLEITEERVDSLGTEFVAVRDKRIPALEKDSHRHKPPQKPPRKPCPD